jgi:predicted GH43/DUF377 family glycosyl hydrolase
MEVVMKFSFTIFIFLVFFIISETFSQSDIKTIPLLNPESDTDWDNGYVGSCTVLYDSTNSLFRMWYSGGQGELLGQVGYATSTDGIKWQKYGNMPVMEEGPAGSWDHHIVGFPTVVIVNDTCRMWYVGGSDEMVVQIGYATSIDGINWTKYGNNPIIRVGTAGSWEETWIFEPCVIYNESVFHMWYTGAKGDWTDFDPWDAGVGYATSTDGINWTKHASNPVFEENTPGNWDDYIVCEQTVLFHNGMFHMWYQGLTSTPGLFPIGYATSADGISWQRSESNPVLIPSSLWELPRHQFPHVIITDSTYHMWYSAGVDFFNWKIGYAKSTDGINWEKHPEPVVGTEPTDIYDTEKHIKPTEYILDQNCPNPFNPVTVISWRLPVSSHVKLNIYNILGQKISTLVSERQSAGKHNVEWNAQGLPSGLYFYRIEAGEYSAVKKMLLIK